MKIYDVRWGSYADTQEVSVQLGFKNPNLNRLTFYFSTSDSRYPVSMGEFGIVYVDVNFATKEVRVVRPEGLFPETVVALARAKEVPHSTQSSRLVLA